MRGVAAYVLAGILVMLAMDMMAPAGVFGVPVKAWPVVAPETMPATIMQSVDRTKKGDRLRAPTAADKRPVPQKAPIVLVGCDPLSSPLSASARANIPGRCLT